MCLNLRCVFKYVSTGFFLSGFSAIVLLCGESLYSLYSASHSGKTHVSTAKRAISTVFSVSLLQPLGHGANVCKKAGPFTSIPFLAFTTRSFQYAMLAVAT